MILCDCCGERILDNDCCTRRPIPRTQTDYDPLGQEEHWCEECNEELGTIATEVKDKYHQMRMDEYYARINALLAKKRRGNTPYEFDYENYGCNPPEPNRGPDGDSASGIEAEEPGSL